MKTTILGAAVAVMATLSVQAVPITGHISFSTASGTWTGDGGNVNTIATIVDFGDVEVDSTSGSFAAIASGTPVVMGQPLDFVAPTSIINPFWSVGGFTFDMLFITAVNRNDNPFGLDTLGLSGYGLLSGNGYDDTEGFWVWSGDLNGTATFTFSSTTVPGQAVPDGGTTVMLLGAALSGLGLIRRRFMA